MKTEKILEIARRHILCFDEGGFIDVELIAFAQAIIEAQLAEDDDEPVAYMKKNGIRFRQGIEPQDDSELPLYRRQQPRARLTDEEIEEIQREFPSRIDLFARAIERKIWEKAE